MSDVSGRGGLAAPGFLERALRRDRSIVIAAVILLTLIAAVYTILGVGMTMSALEMTAMTQPLGAPMDMGSAPSWGLHYAALIWLMWWIMMIAMMTPSAAPTLLLFAALKRQSSAPGSAPAFALAFLGGYLLAWAGFSLIATALQWSLQPTGLIAPAMMTLNSSLLAGGILIAAGAYQFSPWKDVCLKNCRAPAQFLAEHRRPGLTGALRMGAHHGAYCLGCCWALMALLFVGGIMNLYWIVGLAVFVAAEKLLSNQRWIRPLAGGALIVAGGLILSGVTI